MNCRVVATSMKCAGSPNVRVPACIVLASRCSDMRSPPGGSGRRLFDEWQQHRCTFKNSRHAPARASVDLANVERSSACPESTAIFLGNCAKYCDERFAHRANDERHSTPLRAINSLQRYNNPNHHHD